GEIQLDAIAVALRGEQSAARVEARDRVDVEKSFLPKRVRTGECRVTAEVDFDSRREPAQRPAAVVARGQERGLGQVHLRRDAVHPAVIDFAIEKTDGGRISAKRAGAEGVDLE